MHQVKVIKTENTLQEITEKLNMDSKFGSMTMRKTEQGIFIKTGLTIKSWGEAIQIALKNQHETVYEYHISSQPTWKTALVDYGKTLKMSSK